MALPAPVEQPGIQYPKQEQPQIGTIGVSLASQPQAWPLPVAASLLEPYRQHEQQMPDLGVVVSSRVVETHCTPNLYEAKQYAPFQVLHSPLPHQILTRLSTKNFGVLNRLNTVWIGGEQPFFWNLSTGDVRELEISPNSDGSIADIVDVACVPAPVGVFKDCVANLLVISTSKEMRILPVGKDSALYDPDLRIDITGLGKPVVGGDFGRVFFGCAHTGNNLYEFRYSAKETWFKPKVERVCHTEGLFGVVNFALGKIFKKRENDPNSERIISLEVKRGLISILTSHSSVHVYTLDEKSSGPKHLNTFSLPQIRSMVARSVGRNIGPLISLSVVDGNSKLMLVAVAECGTRVYLSLDNSSTIYAQSTSFKMKSAIGDGFVTIGASDADSESANCTLFASFVDMARIAHLFDVKQPIPFVELSGLAKIDGLPLLICFGSKDSLVFTATSLYTVRKRPLSARFEYLDVSSELVRVYGTTQMCCGALDVAINSSGAARDHAIQSLFRFGGLPMFVREESRFLGHASIRLSPLLDGCAVYLARILFPVWNRKVLSDNSSQIVALDQAHAALEPLVKFLAHNRAFSEGLSERQPVATALVPGYGHDDVALLGQAEHKAVQALLRLARSAQEGIAFLRVVLAPKFDAKQVLAYFDSSLLDKLKQQNLGEFFTEGKSSPVARELVNSLVNHVLHSGKTVEQVASTLQSQCPSFCSRADVLEYKALEHIHSVKRVHRRGPAADSSLSRSVDLIIQAASSVQLETLKDVVRDYVSLNYSIGAVKVCMAVAAEQDPANISVGFLRQRPPTKKRLISNEEGHSQAQGVASSEVKFLAKMSVYNILFTELLSKHPELADSTSKDPAHAAMMNAPDEVWHFALYDWYLAHDKQDQIAVLETPYVASFLEQNASKDLRVSQLLWKWYQKHGDLLAAADVLLGLARGPLVPTLGQRVEFLSRALGYCRAQTVQTQQTVRMTTMVNAYLGLALLQSDIQSKLSKEPLNTKIYTVSELFNDWAEPHGLYDVCLAIFEFSDFRDPVEIEQCWDNLLTKTRLEDSQKKEVHYIHVSQLVSQLGAKYRNVNTLFSVSSLVPMLEQYAVDYTPNSPAGWVADTFIKAGVPKARLQQAYRDAIDSNMLVGEYAEHAKSSLSSLN